MDLDELFELVFTGELRADELATLREALERRIAGLRRARSRGDLVDADILALEEQVAVLREEERIAEFVEQSLAASLRREEILAALGELAEGEE